MDMDREKLFSLSLDEIQAAWDTLAAEVRLHRDNKRVSIDAARARRALDGDVGLLQEEASLRLTLMLFGAPLSPFDRYFVAVILHTLSNKKVCRSIAGALRSKGASGRPTSAAKGFAVAMSVLDELLSGAKSVEDAISAIAGERSLSENMVQRYWSDWKPDLIEYLGSFEATDLPKTLARAVSKQKSRVKKSK